MGTASSKRHTNALFIDVELDTWCDLDTFSKAEAHENHSP
jgi:hypothetical protein